METSDDKAGPGSEDASNLSRNRSFKSKQLVRSQAIRESHSPPRSSTPTIDLADLTLDDKPKDKTHNTDVQTYKDVQCNKDDVQCNINDVQCNKDDVQSDKVDASYKYDGNGEVDDSGRMVVTDSSREDDVCSINSASEKIDCNDDKKKDGQAWCPARRGPQLLSGAPRVACVCAERACAHAGGRRRKHVCPAKQDSGIGCSDDCPDCSDNETTGNADGVKKSSSVDSEEPSFYCRCPERKEKPKNLSISRTDSDDKLDPTGPELVAFLKQTLNKNPRDRSTLLKIEKDLHSLVHDSGRSLVRFPVMTSYGRMLVHRCAALFQLSHHLDHHNKTCVLVSKSGTSGGRIPCTPFKAWCTTNFPPSPRHQPDTNAKSILKRDTQSLEEAGSGALSASRSKSLEQREKEYERVRRRIFSTDNCTQDESQWPWMNAGPVKVLTPDAGRNKLLKVQSLESGCGAGAGRRGPVSKSHSFGGYAGERQSRQPRLLSRQGDLASSSWRLSPSSSGYRTLSLHSTDSVTPSPTGGASPEPGGVVWAVTDMSAVPRGALVIHPQTGRPLTNPDGSVYHFDPSNPPVLCDYNPQKVDQNGDKRRGRLEKQHSFIDNENECQVSEECHTKCCCECRRHQPAEKQQPQQPEPKPAQKPPSPCKTRYEQPVETYQEQNHRPPFEPTNQKPEPNRYDNQTYSPTNQQMNRQYENIQKYEVTNQRPNEVVRPPKLQSQESQEMYVQQYPQYRHDEVTSPAQIPNMYQPDMMALQMSQHKMVPLPIPDPNMRPMSLTNMMYPAPMPPPYSYVNQCRMDQPMQTMYQPMLPADKPLPAHAPENTFRIDPSYPYASVDYTGACCAPACLDQQPHRGAAAAGAGEGACVPLMVPHHLHYPYQEQMQWPLPMLPVPSTPPPKLYLQEVYPVPVMYPPLYPYNQLRMPQQAAPPYPPEPAPERRGSLSQRHSKRNSASGSSRNTPLQTPPEDKKYSPPADNAEIQAKIQQIKEQLAQSSSPGEWRRRSGGSGLLGNAPRLPARPANDESQLTSAARAIVNSIRSLQAKNTYPGDRQPYNPAYGRERRREPDKERACRPPYLLRQMSPGTWCRRSPGPVHPVLNNFRRPHPDTRNLRR